MSLRTIPWSLLAVAAAPLLAFAAQISGPSRADIEAQMGLKSTGDRLRGQMDTVGFVVNEAQAEEVVATAVRLEEESLAEQDARLAMTGDNGFVGGICPHDDYLYASRIYVHLTERITAPRVLLVGVFHRARLWGVRNQIVFERFEAWRGPWGEVAVDPLRNDIIAALDPDGYLIDNTMHCSEHSLEAIIPFLQRGHEQRTVVPILVPYMGWDRIEGLTDELSAVVVALMRSRGWRLGRDLAVVVSSDAVHYGPDFDHAPFGTDVIAYQRAVERELRLVDKDLEGEIEKAKLHALYTTLVDPDSLDYRIPWCGRFSIPFGLELLRKISLATEGSAPRGSLLRYGTSLSEPELPVSAAVREAGLGYTAPSNFSHWVGYAAVGYLVPP